jgi:hypothetical protein
MDCVAREEPYGKVVNILGWRHTIKYKVFSSKLQTDGDRDLTSQQGHMDKPHDSRDQEDYLLRFSLENLNVNIKVFAQAKGINSHVLKALDFLLVCVLKRNLVCSCEFYYYPLLLALKPFPFSELQTGPFLYCLIALHYGYAPI